MALPDFVCAVFVFGPVQVALMWWFWVGLLVLCFIAAIVVYAAVASDRLRVDDDQ